VFLQNPIEFDVVEIAGTLRSPTDRALRCCELRLYRAESSLAHDAQAIGFANTRDKVLLEVSGWLPSHAFYSVADALCRGGFKEVEVIVRDMKRGRGPVDGVRFEVELSDLEA
jgi:hypothetical protein